MSGTFKTAKTLGVDRFCLSSILAPTSHKSIPRKQPLAQAKAALDLAKIQFARDQEVIGSNAISKQDCDTKKNTADVDGAQVEAAEAALETAGINLEYCYIHSPIDGRAGARLVDVGKRLDPIYAIFTITEGRSAGSSKTDVQWNVESCSSTSFGSRKRCQIVR